MFESNLSSPPGPHIKPEDLLSTLPPELLADPYTAAFWQQWRTQLHRFLPKPWLATAWLQQSHALLARFNRLYAHLCRQPRPTRRRLQRQLGVSLAGVALALALANAPAHANSFTANDATTLIAAINSANANPGPDTITLTGDVMLSTSNVNAYSFDTGLPLITSQITIEGAGHTIARNSGAPQFRLLAVNHRGDLTLNTVTLSGGNTSGNGGGIFNYEGTVTLNNSTLSGNAAPNGSGGAIYRYYGKLTLNNSTLSGNAAPNGSGGAIITFGYGSPVTVSNSTLSGNSAANSGAIRNLRGSLYVSNSTLRDNTATNGKGGAITNDNRAYVSNSTLSGNSASNGGGAIYNRGLEMYVSNSTLSGNTAGNSGGAIYNNAGLYVSNSTLSGNTAGNSGGAINNRSGLTLERNLIAGNSATTGAEIAGYGGSLNVDNYNLIGYGGSARSAGFTPDATDIVPSGALATILNTSLTNNGGPTLTHALVTGSPAIDAAGDSGLDTDQRGVTRPQGCADDIGAFEFEFALADSEIDVQGNGVSIACRNTTPNTSDGTDFGSVDVSSGTVVRTFTIRNTGTGALILSGSPRVALSGANASDFTVTAQPAVSSVAANGSTTFQITFDPSAVGTRTATVTIANNDSNEGIYTFAIQGAGASKVTSQITQLSFGKVSSTTTPDSTYPSKSTAGVLVARLALKNSGSTLNNLYFRVNVLNNNNWLLSADGAPGQVGSRLTVNNRELPGGNSLWELNESFNQDFRIGVMLAATVQFKVDVYTTSGVAAAGAVGAGDQLLGSYLVELDPTAPDGAQIIYLPAVSK